MGDYMTLLLRKATLADARAITNIYLASRKKFVAFAPLIHSDESIYRWIREVLIPTGQVIVAEENNIIVGMMALSKKKGVGWIDQIYLSPEVVGRGIGTQLVSEAKSLLGSPIRLHTFQENIQAKRFYKKNGFKILELNDGSKNEEKCPDVLYVWRLWGTVNLK
jgi:ribosomal protein S18 acetylase RimI-like enzyme